MAELLERERLHMVKTHEAVAAVVPFRMVPCHLLPPALWETRFGAFLLTRLDLSPYRPWNTILLPLDGAGAAATGLPVRRSTGIRPVSAEIICFMEQIAEGYQGKQPDNITQAFYIVLDAVAQNNPDLLPHETRDLSPNVSRARTRVRSLAIGISMKEVPGLDIPTVRKAHAALLAAPEIQLLA